MKYSDRYDLAALSSYDPTPNQTGSIFINDVGFYDLSNVSIVGRFVDTVRQLFYGLPRPEMIRRLETFSEAKTPLVTLNENGGDLWHFSKMGKVARYRYKLQNNDLGIVILFGSYFQKLDSIGQHLKIELSPHFISQRSITKIWQRLFSGFGSFANAFLENPIPKGCAVHLAVDYQNFALPADFVSNVKCYARTIRAFDDVTELDLSQLTAGVSSFGGPGVEQNYLIGSASNFQVCLYDKTKSAIRDDKIDYFKAQWQNHDENQKVRRIELRFHHQITREVGQHLGRSLEAWPDVAEVLTDLWRYGMGLVRYHLDKNLVHPIWQLLTFDAQFYVPADGLNISRKKKDSIDPVAKNVAMMIGNIITLAARRGFNAKQTLSQLYKLTFYDEIISYYRSRGLGESDLQETIEKGLALRKLIGKAA
ncbi:hypothetical protein [Methylomonas koyamae]|uniref:hypothetical protein n=1 Tax=Methylomonas koyamae TaxID=702114 RepID=UPI0006D237C1|nr:hypothetical protein [Methylomonas koyamae]BBL58147.1 hypothetical protein MKFW12EY_17600 [Methylomonas koyamae]